MIFVKLNIFFIVYNLLVRPMPALDAPQVYHYYQTTRYTMQNEWPPDMEIANAAPVQPPLPQPAAYYITPVAVPVIKPTLVIPPTPPSTSTTTTTTTSTTTTTMKPLMPTSMKPVLFFKPPLVPAVFPNKLSSDLDDATANVTPLNPAPMLKPNPFVNPQGKKIQFSSKSGVGNPLHTNTFNKFNGPQRKEEGAFCRRSFDGRSGYCILAYQCLHVIREYRVHGTKIDICTYRKNIPVICCPLADKHIDDQRISAQKCQEYHEAVRGIKLGLPRHLSGKMCVASIPLIVGGEITQREEYPHMAALGWTQSDKELKWGCGGTLISDLFVLTAAHCATSGGKPPDMVRLGTQNLNRTTEDQQDIKILIIILHPKYRSSSYYHDIALLKLTRRVRFSQHIQPACLWQLPDLEMSTAIATGWGRTEFLGPKSDELQKVDLNIIDQKTCKEIYRKERRLPRGIIEGQFCAGHLEGGKDTCQGDSGGPLHAELPEFNCVKFIIGITSFGKFCAAPNAPGVYTKIYSYLDWIEKIVFRG
ncbi:serine protease snake [Lucilia sericata]|uniref:serine protease snake n=1 Tax=Lucilia sericata TaxID=13632 RepID=UPI0018A7F3CE|nr:serine protease snake [Lucilia sericata]